MESLRVARAIDRARVLQFACIQNIADGRYVMGILPTGCRETLIYIILSRVLDMLPGNIGCHTLTWCCLLFTVGHRKKDYTRRALDLSGSTIDTGKPLY